jgi:acetylornithine deacetylase
MKGGLVAARLAAGANARSGVRLDGDLLLASVVGEEDGGLGTFGLLRHGVTADACVITEPTDLHVVPANGGALTFRLTIPGRAAHGSRRTEGVSAVDKLPLLLAALADLERRRNADVDPLMARWDLAYPISVGVVRAGDWASTVPDRLVAEGRYGVALGEPLDTARAELERAVAEASAADPWLAEHPVRVEWWGGQFAPGHTDPGHPLVAATLRAHATAAPDGRPAEVFGGPYGSDLRLLTGLGRIPTVQYGPGRVDLAHSPDERVPLADVAQVARACALLALDWCGIAGAGS